MILFPYTGLKPQQDSLPLSPGPFTAGATTGLHPPSGSPLRRDGNRHRRVDSPQRTASPFPLFVITTFGDNLTHLLTKVQIKYRAAQSRSVLINITHSNNHYQLPPGE
jgi:hypothetical protein